MSDVGRELDAMATAAIAEALELAPMVAETPGSRGWRTLGVQAPTEDGARFIVKRINEALMFSEFLEDVEVRIVPGESGATIRLSQRAG